MRITLVAGLPASGKSTLLAALAGQGAKIIDDIGSLDALPTASVDWLAIADVNFCGEDIRQLAVSVLEDRFPGAAIDWVFFENDPAACLEVAAARNDGRNVGPDILSLSRRYTIPAGKAALPVPQLPARPKP